MMTSTLEPPHWTRCATQAMRGEPVRLRIPRHVLCFVLKDGIQSSSLVFNHYASK